MTITNRMFLDEAAQAKLEVALRHDFKGAVSIEQMRIMGRGNVIACVVVALGNSTPHKKGTLFSLRASVNGGRIDISVGDGIIQLKRKSWRRGQLKEAIAWAVGYIEGYMQ